MAKYMDQSGAQHFAEALMSATKTINGQAIWGDGNIEAGGSATQTTYSAFKTLVENGELVPGAQYVITDYQAVPNATYAKKDPNIAVVATTYLIIRALTAYAYDENASLVVMTQTGVEPVTKVYNIKYTIENKGFIDQNSGRGTITYMHDPSSGNVAPWDWRMGHGIVSTDATKTTFFACTNCTIACGDSDNIPCITLESCTDCNIGPDNSNIDLQNCERVNIKNGSLNIYLQYVYDCNIGYECNDIHIKGSSKNYYVRYMNIGDYCSFIFVLSPSNGGSLSNVIGNSCSYVQFIGSNIIIGNKCRCIYLSGYTGGYIQASNDVTVGNNCLYIGLNSTFSSFDSLKTNYMHFDNCSIGDNCSNICFSSITSSSRVCMFSNCDFQKINGFHIKPTTIGVNITDKMFKHINFALSYPLDTSASTPTNWKIQVGDISYDADSHRFAFRRPTDSTWTDIH